ncbi:MAG: ABC transporter ATP-binding protein [Proteobacteria bacterium]|nr:ABC transporter ATP-binding protein [Pseudomonadota bacterium]
MPEPTTPDAIRLALHGVGCRFGKVTAVDDVTLELRAGEFVSLLGPSGCGKTTTLRMIAGFIHPTAGTIAMDGEVLSSPSGSQPPQRRNMSMIFQSYAIWPHMTVAQNVAFGVKLRGLNAATVKQKVERILDIVRLRHLAERYPATLSGGQQQRVALARAMVVEPRVLLLDEPLSNLDASLREEMRFEIRRLHDEFRMTSIYVTHDQAEAMVTSHRIAVMNHGRVEQVGTPYAIYNNPKTRFVAGFIGRTNLLEGKAQGRVIRFDGFAADTTLFAFAAELDGDATLSVRPQSIGLAGAAPAPVAGRRMWSIEGTVTQRAYLGEFWDYIVAPLGGNMPLRVSAPPAVDFDVGARVWMSIDPTQVVHVT